MGSVCLCVCFNKPSEVKLAYLVFLNKLAKKNYVLYRKVTQKVGLIGDCTISTASFAVMATHSLCAASLYYIVTK